MASVATAGMGEGGSINRKNLDKARLQGWVPGEEVRSNPPVQNLGLESPYEGKDHFEKDELGCL